MQKSLFPSPLGKFFEEIRSFRQKHNFILNRKYLSDCHLLLMVLVKPPTRDGHLPSLLVACQQKGLYLCVEQHCGASLSVIRLACGYFILYVTDK